MPASRNDSSNKDAGIIIESTHFPNAIKVTAIDPRTGTEVSILSPHSASKQQREKVVVQKLKYVLEKKRADF